MLKLLLFSAVFYSVSADWPILKGLNERKDLEHILIDLINGIVMRYDVTCVALICDDVYLNVFEGDLFKKTYSIPFVMTVVEENEDLLSPNFITLESLRAARKDGCNVYVILLANGIQASRLLRFGDRYRILDTRAKYLMLHDFRLFHSDLHYLWKRIVNVIFLKHHRKITGVLKSKAWFDLSTVPFPNPIKSVLVTRRLDIWGSGKFHYNRVLFNDKTSNLNGEVLNVVYLDHTPSVVVEKTNETNRVGGVEIEVILIDVQEARRRLMQVIMIEDKSKFLKIENLRYLLGKLKENFITEIINGVPNQIINILYFTFNSIYLCTYLSNYTFIAPYQQILKTLAEKMNFIPKLYQAINGEHQKWGQKQSNGSFSGLLGEMVNGHGDVALGNLQYTPYHLELTDLSIPYTSQCWTFLTPEALTDNSWMTLILPFKLYMWIAVLLVLLITGTIFYGLAQFYLNLQVFKMDHEPLSKWTKKQDEIENDAKPVGLYLFGEIINSILYTYGMLLVVSLPKLPSGWSIRLLTGWYWLYCILLVVSYRASMTAILANPAPRVTIDTLQELVDSKVTCGGWGEETKKFFDDSLDEIGQKIGQKFESINEPLLAANKVASGVYAYYDSENFLKYLRVKRNNGSFVPLTVENSTNATEVLEKSDVERSLHIMSDCVVNIPISIGFHKNSPLKPLADIYMRRVVEVGLVEKWLNDAMYTIRSSDRNEEEIKALMNLKKLYGAFIALAIGYLVSAVCLLGELLHWHLIVKRDPKFDKYALNEYYRYKNKKN